MKKILHYYKRFALFGGLWRVAGSSFVATPPSVVVVTPLLLVRVVRTKRFHPSQSPTMMMMSTDSNAEQQQKQEQSPQQPAETQKQQRRPRYSGKYPRNFHEKYKEHQGDEETIAKVLNKGMTPAGTHVPIMLSECLEYMGLRSLSSQQQQQQQQQQQLVVDCTLGYGGHSSHILQCLQQQPSGGGTLFGFDQDSIEIAKTSQRLLEICRREDDDNENEKHSNLVQFIPVNQNFATVKSYLESKGCLGRVTCLLADLGLSSMQIDDNQRGFTYKREGPLDMRMNPNDPSRETAYQLLQRLKPKEFKRLLEENSDEVYAEEIAFGLLQSQGKGSGGSGNNNIPKTTLELAYKVRDIVQPLMEKDKRLKKNAMKPALDSTVARTMQALRIEVNGEFQVLEHLLHDLPDILAPGGRAVFLTFHSGEDRRVKKALKSGFKSGVYSEWSRDVVRPSNQERRDNPRSSCCKFRWAVRSII